MQTVVLIISKIKLDVSEMAVMPQPLAAADYTHRNLRFLLRHSSAISFTFDWHREIAFSSSSVTKRPARKGSCSYKCPLCLAGFDALWRVDKPVAVAPTLLILPARSLIKDMESWEVRRRYQQAFKKPNVDLDRFGAGGSPRNQIPTFLGQH